MLHSLKENGNRLDVVGCFSLADRVDVLLRQASSQMFDIRSLSDRDLQYYARHYYNYLASTHNAIIGAGSIADRERLESGLVEINRMVSAFSRELERRGLVAAVTPQRYDAPKSSTDSVEHTMNKSNSWGDSIPEDALTGGEALSIAPPPLVEHLSSNLNSKRQVMMWNAADWKRASAVYNFLGGDADNERTTPEMAAYHTEMILLYPYQAREILSSNPGLQNVLMADYS